MNNCYQCGVSLPEGQDVCSMCYGDMDYGNDGFYEDWLEDIENEIDKEDNK